MSDIVDHINDVKGKNGNKRKYLVLIIILTKCFLNFRKFDNSKL